MSVRYCSKQKIVMEMLAKTLDRYTMIARKLLMKSEVSKPRVAEGLHRDRALESEGREVRLVHSDRGDAVVCEVPDEGQDITETDDDIMNMSKVPACRERAPCLQHQGVNVAEEDAREYPE